MEQVPREGRSLAETPTWSVATVTAVMVFVCFLVERAIYRFGKWLQKTKRKAISASLEKIKEELMLLGLISLMLGQCARWISEICVDSSLFNSRFYLCSQEDFGIHENFLLGKSLFLANETDIPPRGLFNPLSHQCSEGREPFVSYEGLEQLHRFLFVLGITHVLYSCLAVGLAMTKIYSWRKWEYQASALAADGNLQAKRNKMMRQQNTFAFHHASHPWSRNRVLIWMLCFLRQFKSSIRKSDYLALRLGFVTNHELPLSYNFHKYMVRSMEDEFHAIVGISWPLWGYAILCIFLNIHGNMFPFRKSLLVLLLTFMRRGSLDIKVFPIFQLVMLVGTKLEHVVSLLALEISEPTGLSIGVQVKPRDELFWFGKPEIILRLIQFISFQWGFKQQSCFMKNHVMVIIRLTSGFLVQFWCSYSTVPVSVVITQMGSKCKKSLVAESVRESLHSWCKRVKEKSKHSHTARSVCSLESTIDERDETTTIASLTLSPCSSAASLNEVVTAAQNAEQPEEAELENSAAYCDDRVSVSRDQSTENIFSQPHEGGEAAVNEVGGSFLSLF